MPKFLIEREIADAGRLTPAELQAMSQQIEVVVRQLGAELTWVLSCVTDDRFYCLYVAAGDELLRKHSRLSGMPVQRVMRVRRVISPAGIVVDWERD